MQFRHSSSNRLRIAAPAKLNLYLELLRKRTDGFHEIETVMATVSIYDQLSFVPNDTGRLRLSVASTDANAAPVPNDDRNLVYRSLDLLREIGGGVSPSGQQSRGMDVDLLKRIPSSAGLGGASSNAAAALIAGNVLWNLGLSDQQLHHAASQIGSDVPFFLTGGTAMCRGRGEIIEPLPAPAGLNFVIAKPQVGLSTPVVYRRCDLESPRVQSRTMVDSVIAGNAESIGKGLFNRMQSAAAEIACEIPNLEETFEQLHCLGHQMSGSGSSYFGLFSNQKMANAAASRLAARCPGLSIFCVRSLNRRPVLTA
jgi:4-diphosphocytidyl-2-C-methyl-D-erythritol kinase